MVCRENKSRSAIMGLTKLLQSKYGDDVYHDAEVQSLIHERRHELEGLKGDAPTTEEQLSMLDRMIQQIESNPDISDGDKYRPNRGRASRPGLITRLNEEKERIRTGKDEHGNPLTAAQKNDMAHMLSIMSMGRQAESIVPARKKILEMNARHRGMSMEDVEAEYKEIINRPGAHNHNSGVPGSLRDSMSMAGLSSTEQATISQAGRVRDALAEMEAKRVESIKNLPSRSTIGKEDEQYAFSSDGSHGKAIKCAQCGQFGHFAHSCPNEKKVEILTRTEEGLKRIEEMESYWEAKSIVAEIGEDGQLTTWHSIVDNVESTYGDKIVPQERLEQVRDGLLATRQRTKEQLRQDNLEVLVDEHIGYVGYNRETGVLTMTPQDSGAPVQVRRVSAQTYKDFEKAAWLTTFSQAWDEVIESDTAHHFENPADEQAGLVQYRCPTCGQWASLNSSHQCPVPGGPTEQNLAEVMRRRRENAGMQVTINSEKGADWGRRYNHAIPDRTKDGQVHRVPFVVERAMKPGAVAEKTANGTLVANYAIAFQDGKVSGNITAWRDPNDPDRILMNTGPTNVVSSSASLRCDCDQYKHTGNCKHIRFAKTHIGRTFARTGEVTFTPAGTQPGMTVEGKVGADIDNIGPRVDYSTLRTQRQEETTALVKRVQADRANPLAGQQLSYTRPTDAEGNEVDYPTSFQRTGVNRDGFNTRVDGRTIDLRDSKAVRDEMATALRSRTGRGAIAPDGKKVGGLRASVKMDKKTGGMWIDVTVGQKKKGFEYENFARREIAKTLGVPVRQFGPKGYYVGSDTASRAEALHRACRENPPINGPKTIYTATGESLRNAARESVVPTTR